MTATERIAEARKIIDLTLLDTQAQLWREMSEELASKVDAQSSLLKRAADSLQDYRAQLDGDYNDSVAMEIYKVIGE
jgi:hypothetical protein